MALCLIVAGCQRVPIELSAELVPPSSGAPAVVRIVGLTTTELSALRRAALDDTAWQAVFRVSVSGGDETPVVGRYAVTREALEFTPAFPFDPGRAYAVRFDPARLPAARDAPALLATLELPARVEGPRTIVTAISPGAPVWPENLLRFYIHFSAPMSRTGAIGVVHLVDAAGREVPDAFLPLDVDLWNADRTRFTVFFDPGRVKRGIRPNVELGRALDAGRDYAIVVDTAWRDAQGQPLASPFRHAFQAGPAEERAIAIADWRIQPPPPRSRDPLRVTFPWGLDRGLLQRAIGVARGDGAAVEGEILIEDADRLWQFVPRDPWRAGGHQLVVLTLLEDPAGNRVGRPFEMEMLEAPGPATTERVSVPFEIR